MKNYYDIFFHYVFAIYQNEIKTNTFLPNEDAIAKTFNVSRPTVRKAIKKLNEVGLTKTISGKGTQVILDPAEPKHAETFSRLTAEYIKVIGESFSAISVLVSICVDWAFDKITDEDKAFMKEYKEKFAQIETVDDWINLYKTNYYEFFVKKVGIAQMHNSYMELFSLLMPNASLMNSNRIPLSEIKSTLTRHGHRIYDAVMEGDKNAVLKEISEHYKSFYKILSSRARKKLKDFDLYDSESLVEEIFSEKDPLHMLISMSILSSIYCGNYKHGQELPSQIKLAEIYNTTRTTINKAISTLCEWGATKVLPNKRVVVAVDITEPKSLEILEGYAKKLEAPLEDIVECFAMCIPYICAYSIQKATDEDIAQLEKYLDELSSYKYTDKSSTFIFKEFYDMVTTFTHNFFIVPNMLHLNTLVAAVLPYYFRIYQDEGHLNIGYLFKFKELLKCYRTKNPKKALALFREYAKEFVTSSRIAFEKLKTDFS